MTDQLGSYEGQPVLAVGITIPNAGGGLRDPLSIEPRLIHPGEELYIVLKVKPKGYKHEPIPKANGWLKTTVLEALDGAFVDAELVAPLLAAQAERLAAKKAAEQEAPLPLDKDLLQIAHMNGHHQDLEEGCPDCDAEVQAAADEAASGADDSALAAALQVAEDARLAEEQAEAELAEAEAAAGEPEVEA